MINSHSLQIREQVRKEIAQSSWPVDINIYLMKKAMVEKYKNCRLMKSLAKQRKRMIKKYGEAAMKGI